MLCPPGKDENRFDIFNIYFEAGKNIMYII